MNHAPTPSPRDDLDDRLGPLTLREVSDAGQSLAPAARIVADEGEAAQAESVGEVLHVLGQGGELPAAARAAVAEAGRPEAAQVGGQPCSKGTGLPSAGPRSR